MQNISLHIPPGPGGTREHTISYHIPHVPYFFSPSEFSFFVCTIFFLSLFPTIFHPPFLYDFNCQLVSIPFRHHLLIFIFSFYWPAIIVFPLFSRLLFSRMVFLFSNPYFGSPLPVSLLRYGECVCVCVTGLRLGSHIH